MTDLRFQPGAQVLRMLVRAGMLPARAGISLLVLLLSFTGAKQLNAHAGHSHGPEIGAPSVADVPPRFYGTSDALEVILTFPSKDRTGDPVLFVANKADNTPVSHAKVSVDILSGEKARVKVADGSTSGSYLLRGLGWPETTVSLSVEVEQGDLLEILSIDRILPAVTDESNAGPVIARGPKNSIAGLPAYLIVALVCMNGILAVVAVLALILWIVRKKTARPSTLTGLLILLVCTGSSGTQRLTQGMIIQAQSLEFPQAQVPVLHSSCLSMRNSPVTCELRRWSNDHYPNPFAHWAR